MLEKTYQPKTIEARVHQDWSKARAFEAGRPERAKAPAYSIVIPPPNVTGSLHMGHALNNTLQDVLCRFERMRGKDVLWQPGTDHAGIATQLVVEKQMMERQEPHRRTIGREKFLEKVWAWKAESGGTIINQLKRLGASCDWSRERFTMDEGLSAAVLKVFVDLYNQGLIYRDKRLVNWDPEFQSALSDLEVDMVELKGSLWHFRYPLSGGLSYRFPTAYDEGGAAVAWEARNFIVVATTRPETMLGDTAVAVHPEDARYQDLIGKTVMLPLVGREIPIIADEYSNPEIGSGAVKITPAHDFNDYQVGKRHNLPLINIFDAKAQLNDNVPAKYRGLDRLVARKEVVADLEAQGLLEKVEPTVHAVPHAQRGNALIEPWLTDQWYVNAAELAKRAIAAVEDGSTKFIPKNWEKTYFEWMRNIQPWCISRQLWWGHQIPAWYGPDGRIFVALDEADAQRAAAQHYQQDVRLRRDEDVLDTWFSSALWPFSTLGWPQQTPELSRYYPTSALVTGFDIIFFWVARMMMMGLHFMREIPFHDVYIHALVRDDKGQKMSKTRGNVMDPLGMIDQYGADALRFTLAAMAAQGRDIKLSTHRVEGYRNFATKLWNAARFAEMNECVRQKGFDPKSVAETLNRWIAGEVERTAAAVTTGIETYKFNEAATAIYEFTWGTFCDWYLELAKPILNGDDEAAKAETRATTAWVLDQILKLLHPFMPFITEELWDRLVEVGVKRENLLCLSAWPVHGNLADRAADEEIGWLVNLVSEIRSVRSEMNVPAGAKTPLIVVAASKVDRARAENYEETIKRLARIDTLTFAKAVPPGSAQIVLGETTVALPLAGVIDMGTERTRLAREIEKSKAEIKKIDAKLANQNFVAKAPPEVVEENRERRADFEATMKRLQAALKRVEAAA
ncbi:MAG TPA: valine--tRNA ligase [Hyphomicrobiaceae bacterium]|nr:valine--tRNA ligase [Hyphomicrobiaceae bacterium]